MPFVNKSGGENEEESTDVAAGAPPQWDIDFDPNDPDQVKVHYDLGGWNIDQRAELAETLAEQSIPHVWEGDELVVPEAIEGPVDRLFEQLEAELGPFPVWLDRRRLGHRVRSRRMAAGRHRDPQRIADRGRDPASLGGHDPLRRERRRARGRRPARRDRSGEVASIDGATEAPDGALQSLYSSADRLRRDPTHTSAREELFALVPKLNPTAPPYGLAAGSWATMVAAASTLVAAFQAGRPTDELEQAAEALHGVCRPWV